jgi:hypothetical protein
MKKRDVARASLATYITLLVSTGRVEFLTEFVNLAAFRGLKILPSHIPRTKLDLARRKKYVTNSGTSESLKMCRSTL